MRSILPTLAFLVVGCGADEGPRGPKDKGETSTTATSSPVRPVEPIVALGVQDLGLSSALQDRWFGHYNRGRALVAADFDLDGRVDFFLGSPGDKSFVLRNTTEAGSVRFELAQQLVDGHLTWGAAAADYDNDGDFDLFLTGGGNECADDDLLFRNDWVETGTLSFTDVTAESGLAAPARPSANAVWGDIDDDGDVDLFVNGQYLTLCGLYPRSDARNTLWRNEGDGTFVDVTEQVGLHLSEATTQNSTLVDLDNDGDLDLFESNNVQHNRVWRNRLAEDGELWFDDVSWEVGPGALAFFDWAFASCAADFDDDGWEDIIVFERSPVDTVEGPASHSVYLNRGGVTFDALDFESGLAVRVERRLGVMGCQIGDLDANGVIDVFVGNGGPIGGGQNQLYLGQRDPLRWEDHTPLIDTPAPLPEGVEPPSYPYRTHGTVIVDVDGDHAPEIAVINGGPASYSDLVREPNRLFQFQWSAPPTFLWIAPRGDGVHTSRDGIGTRLALTVETPEGTRVMHRTLFGGSCFSAQNGFQVAFGLHGVRPLQLDVEWTDGRRETIDVAADSRGRWTLTYPSTWASSTSP